jgi:nucleoside-diphosphate-sugar epimerase
MPHLLAHDLDHIFNCTRSLWKDLRGGQIFLTGGTSSAGIWLLESFLRANDELQLKAHAVVLTRDSAAFQQKLPHLSCHPSVQIHQGDIRNFSFPAGRFTHIIHAAGVRDPRLYAEHPLRMLDVVLSGTRRVLDFTLQSGNPKFLLCSSGAVYGRQPPGLEHIPEDFPGEPNLSDPGSVFGEGNRLSEALCLTYGRHYGLRIKIARCFSWIGPNLPLESGSVVGRFIWEGLQGGPILVNGNGQNFCSYIYAADMAVWLWSILVEGECGRAYNVGSEQAVPIPDLARQVGQIFNLPVELISPLKSTNPVPGLNQLCPEYPGSLKDADSPATDMYSTDFFIPSTQAARSSLHLEQAIGLEEAIRRTVEWHRAEGSAAHA